SLHLISLFAFCFNTWLNGVASSPSLVCRIKHSVDRLVIVSIFIPKLPLILILNTVLGRSDSSLFSQLFQSLAPRPLAARSISDFLLTYLATRSEERFSRKPRPISYAVFCLKKKKRRPDCTRMADNIMDENIRFSEQHNIMRTLTRR